MLTTPTAGVGIIWPLFWLMLRTEKSGFSFANFSIIFTESCEAADAPATLASSESPSATEASATSTAVSCSVFTVSDAAR